MLHCFFQLASTTTYRTSNFGITPDIRMSPYKELPTLPQGFMTKCGWSCTISGPAYGCCFSQ